MDNNMKEIDTSAFDIVEGTSFFKLTEADACVKARGFPVDLKEAAQPENYFRSVIIKSTIRAALIFNERDQSAIMQYMKSRYPECGFKNYQQMQQQLLWDHRRVMRYIKADNRKPSFPKGMRVIVGNIPYVVKPDVAFECGKAIELVIFKIGKPTMTQTGRSNAFQRDMLLYAMVLYGRMLGYQNVTASIYFLKKTSDTGSWNQCSQSFFGDGDNIVQITDLYFGGKTELDKKMEALIEMNELGIPEEDQAESTCEYCKNYDICKYTLPPKKVEEEEEKESAATAKVSFSPSQEQAIAFSEGVARIIAGAGSGKTKVVVERVVRLLKSGVKPWEILMITFTKSGAGEMKRRVEQAFGRTLEGLAVTTFNALQNDIVLDNWEDLGFKRKPKVIDDVEQFAIIADLLTRKPILEWGGRAFLNFSATKGFGTRGALSIAKAVFKACKKAKSKNGGTVDASDVRDAASYEEISDAALAKLVDLYDEYEKIMKEKGLIEFDDQELLTFKVLDMDPNYLEKNYKFAHIIVDEFQDTSEGQIQFVKKLKEIPTYKSLMVVGDDLQAIYGFRDTSPEYIVHFEDYIGEHVEDIYLDRNFRSTPQICAFAKRLIKPNRDKVDKDLIAARPDGVPVIVNSFSKQKEEYDYIVSGIRQHLMAGMRPEDIAVLAYTKNELVKIADALTKAGIPSMFGAPEPLMQNSRIRAILSFARVVTDSSDTKDAAIAANAIIGGGIMDRPEEEVEAMIADIIERASAISGNEYQGKELFLRYIDEIAMDDEAVENFRDSLENKDIDEIIEYCRNFSMYGDGVEYRRTQKYPGVALVTAHSSKGLEWPVIYNTITKYMKNGRMSRAEVEEIRRLLFVSATRARDELYVTGLLFNGTKNNKVENIFLREALAAMHDTGGDSSGD